MDLLCTPQWIGACVNSNFVCHEGTSHHYQPKNHAPDLIYSLHSSPVFRLERLRWHQHLLSGLHHSFPSRLLFVALRVLDFILSRWMRRRLSCVFPWEPSERTSSNMKFIPQPSRLAGRSGRWFQPLLRIDIGVVKDLLSTVREQQEIQHLHQNSLAAHFISQDLLSQ